jgi:hypothetical protein
MQIEVGTMCFVPNMEAIVWLMGRFVFCPWAVWTMDLEVASCQAGKQCHT